MELAKTGRVRILMLVGPTGTGKTSTARLFAATYFSLPYKDIADAASALPGVPAGCPYYKEVNASGERGIDVIRTLDTDYISIESEEGKTRIIVFDEADGLTYQAQEALKAITERRAYNCIFIFCLNKIYRMDSALLSRSAIFYYDPVPYEQATKWLEEQAPKLDIKLPSNIASKVVSYYHGDMRRIANNFLDVYQGSEVTKFQPKPTYAEIIFNADNPSEKYLELAAKEYLDPDDLLTELLRLNKNKNPAIFGQACLIFDRVNPQFAILHALTALEK
jgi:DNA polymerase III delta prime subunit